MTDSIPIVYVCHPFADDPAENARRVLAICRRLATERVLPVGPHIYLPQFLDEKIQRDEALAMCLRLVELCAEVRVFGEVVTHGMQREIDHAIGLGIPVRFVDPEATP